MSALIRLREVVRRRRCFWQVEIWQADRLTKSSTYPNRREARADASSLARKLDAVVILAGPDRPIAALAPKPPALKGRANGR